MKTYSPIENALKIFNASAGSGKTYTLVREYLRIILQDADPNKMKFRKILAMTFTNKAANEMKERILAKLIQLSKAPHDRTATDISEIHNFSKEFGLSEDQLIQRSGKCLNAILHNYGMFSVMTIDKFTHKIIRTFARDLGLSVDFEVELDLETLRSNVADMLFDQIGRDPEISRLMLSYADSNLDEDRSWNFKHSLVEFSKQLFQENALQAIQHLSELNAKDFLEAKNKLIKERSMFENKLHKMGKEAFDFIQKNNLNGDDFKYTGKGGIYSFLEDLAVGKVPDEIKKRPRSYAADGGFLKASAPSIDEGVIQQYCNQIIDYYDEQVGRYLLNFQILRIVNNLSLMKHMLRITDELKEEDNVLLISDFYKKISEIIANEPVPFIYERLGVRYDHFLLDEFQDTSHMQWINLVPLLHNSLAQKHTNLIVGDAKQAIYRWRNGEVEQFIALPKKVYNPQEIESLKEAEQTIKREGEVIQLESNYRSAGEIVQFNNQFFEALASQQDEYIKDIYQLGKQKVQKELSGYLEFNLVDDKTDNIQHEYVLEVIQRSLEKGYKLSDICILTRKNKIGSSMATFLTTKGVKVISQDSLFVSKDLTVRFLFNLIAGLAHPNAGNYSKKTIEYYDLIFGKNEQQQLLNMTKKKKVDLLNWLKEQGVEVKSIEHFHSFYEYTEQLIEVFNIDLENNAYVQHFLEQIHLYEKRHSTNVYGFIEWFKEKGYQESINSPEGAEAVNIMTIHKAKGLQYPVVICAHFDWDHTSNRSEKWILDKEEKLPAFYLKSTKATKQTKHRLLMEEEDMKTVMDNLNLVYVAFTRAERALFVCGHIKGKSKNLAVNWIYPHLKELEASGKIKGEGSRYLLGEFEYSAEKEPSGISHYDLTFLKQKMGKPTLSTSNAESWDFHNIDRKRLYGSQLHLVLSKMKNADELDKTLTFLIRKGKVDEEFEDQLREDIQRLFMDDHFNAYFNRHTHVLNESVIVDREGKKHIPDKIIFKEEEVLLVDFKSGKEQPEKYEKQVKNYMLLMQDQGYRKVRGEIFYTEDCTVSKVLIG